MVPEFTCGKIILPFRHQFINFSNWLWVKNGKIMLPAVAKLWVKSHSKKWVFASNSFVGGVRDGKVDEAQGCISELMNGSRVPVLTPSIPVELQTLG
jgi:hypothetical protein